MSEYVFFLAHIFANKDRIYNSVLKRENIGSEREKPYSGIFYAV